MSRAVIFDVDGTLVDSNDLHVEAWQEAFAHFGKQIPKEALHHQIGKGGDQYIPVFLSADELRRFGSELEKFRTHLYQTKYLPRVRPFAKVRELFERLKADGKRILLASSGKQKELNFYEQKLGIENLVDDFVSADDVERSKPHPDIFKSALHKLDEASRKNAIVIGDTPYDAQAAAKSGLGCIGVLCGGFKKTELRDAGAIAVYRDPADLLEHYASSPLA